ncbi:glycoside hydrolase family 2 TIM barrel-domain containing protein [Sphingobacterium sp. Mn56C]|uniref:glycoside hydrolase family 2 protein n=1 Tax=Sphingobacterium sp. Mn56C TaxID=3395261 RepID=UPI003BE76E5A
MKKILCLLCCTFCCTFSFLYAQQSSRLLSGWEFVKQDLGGIWEAVRPVGDGAPEASPIWQTIQLPHSYNQYDAVAPFANYYQGPGWYRTFLDISNPYPAGRTLLHFEGAGQKTQVYVYQEMVKEHIGGYDEWHADITDAVARYKKDTAAVARFKGKVPIVIRVDNTRDLELIPSDLSDFNLYGGLYRYVNLNYVPALSVAQLFADVKVDNKGKKGVIAVRSRFRNPQLLQAAQVLLTISDPQGKKISSHSASVDLSSGADLPIGTLEVKNPQLWSTAQPTLYSLTLTVVHGRDTATTTQKIGFRTFEFIHKGPFMLNGKRLLLKGTHRHEDHAGVGPAMTAEQIWEEMRLMKEMGVNFIRLGHYQQSRIVLEACDALGILVWEEIPWCRGGLGGALYQEQGKRMLTHMIEQHYNHPSVIIWGLGNENDWPGDFQTFDKEQIRTYMKALNDLSHRLDPSRKTAIRRCDFCKDIVDVYSPSIWAGWYRGVYTDYKAASFTEFNQTHSFLHVEWGGDSHARRHSETPDEGLPEVAASSVVDERTGDASLFGGPARVSKDGDWSESYIVNLIDWHLKEQETMPWLTGTAYWPFKDFSTPLRPENPVPYVNQKGVVERNLTKKESFYVFQSYWADKPMAHIYGHSWPIRWGDEGQERMVKVYSNCDEAELFVNGLSLGVRKRNSQDFPAAGLRWMVKFVTGENKIEVVARKGDHSVRDSIVQYYQTSKWGKPAMVSFKVLEDHGDSVLLEAYLRDENGVKCLDARDYINFQAAGDGYLRVDQGTSDGSSRLQVYNGRALVTLMRTGAKVVVTAHADNIGTAMIDLSSEML